MCLTLLIYDQWLFGKRKTPEEVVKEHQRTINRAIRELERERNRLQQSEKKIILDIKKSAKVGQMVRFLTTVFMCALKLHTYTMNAVCHVF